LLPPPPPPPRRTHRAALIALAALGTVAAVLGVALAIVLIVGDDRDDPPPPPALTQDEQAIEGAEAIARGAELYAAEFGYGPSVDDALPTGALAQFVDPWPTNPFTGAPMAPGSSPGDYTFYTATSMGYGEEYLGYVYVTLSTGETYSAPFEY
jgi:hypothetical protein